MNLIIEHSSQMPSHTDIKLIFDALGGRQREFNWLITEQECSYWTSDIDIFNKELIYLSGDELTDIVTQNNIQFIWGILSAFDKSVNIDINNLSVIPTFDGEWKYGGEDVHTQHPLATAEIVCVDSSYTIFLSKDEDLLNRFLKHFSDAQDLHQWNRKLQNK
jgi:small nuclear ribonucleoprotein (snRNP)-like protein